MKKLKLAGIIFALFIGVAGIAAGAYALGNTLTRKIEHGITYTPRAADLTSAKYFINDEGDGVTIPFENGVAAFPSVAAEFIVYKFTATTKYPIVQVDVSVEGTLNAGNIEIMYNYTKGQYPESGWLEVSAIRETFLTAETLILSIRIRVKDGLAPGSKVAYTINIDFKELPIG